MQERYSVDFETIENTNKRIFFLSRISNRTVAALSNVLEGREDVNSIFFTDGYPSYPTIAENLSLQHHIVNHSEGFVNEDGIHTNNIEGFWSYLKLEMRRQGGVLRNNIDEWLADFTFRKII
ncbi:hypothetical protein H311_00386 [Anncaliia algerae PRA109]|nr:hypothetical protein H311_00386 [Anncaliia algerae PRA109]